jgi:hypothetical protein
VGDFDIEVPDEAGEGKHWEHRYGIKVFSPIAKNFPYGITTTSAPPLLRL